MILHQTEILDTANELHQVLDTVLQEKGKGKLTGIVWNSQPQKGTLSALAICQKHSLQGIVSFDVVLGARVDNLSFLGQKFSISYDYFNED